MQETPTGHGFLYPTTLDLTTGMVRGKWFAPELAEAWANPDGDPVALRIDRRHAAQDVVVLHCLDPVYGHALLRLLNAQRHLDHEPDGRALVVLVPRALEALVPDGVAEAWIVDEPLGRLRGWLLDLEERIPKELDRFDSWTLSPAYPHPHPSTYDLGRFTGWLEPQRFGAPSILFAPRPDRLWGTSETEQRTNFERLFALLRLRWPDAGAVSVGTVPPGQAPDTDGITDLTTPRPDLGCEREWLAAMKGADLVVGAHGSNMLLPSALAKTTIELLPRGRYLNPTQATIVAEPDPVLALYRYRVIHGDDELSDVAPERVAEIAGPLVDDLDGFRAHFTGPYAGVPVDGPPPPAAEPEGEWRPVEPERAPGGIRPIIARALGRDAPSVAALAERHAPGRVARATQDDVLAATTRADLPDAEIVLVTLQGPRAVAAIDRLERAGLRAHVAREGVLRPMRLPGPPPAPVEVAALPIPGREEP